MVEQHGHRSSLFINLHTLFATRASIIAMKDRNLSHLCRTKRWPEVWKYLSSDAAEEEKKSNIMCRSDARTCLHYACCRDPPDDIVKAMIDIGGKELVMMTDDNDRTVLHLACCNGASYNIIKMLIEVGRKDLVMAKDSNFGDTALHDICRFITKHTKAAEKMKLILQVGDANLLLATKNKGGQTPLKIATDNGASKEIQKLLTVQSNSKRKPCGEEHQEEGEKGLGAVSQSQSSKRSRIGNAADNGYPNSRSEMYHKFMNRDRGLD
eukprot:scaffold842_cov287-Chaetoceros_neogracile.AAC.19